jgi:hypothetical protein
MLKDDIVKLVPEFYDDDDETECQRRDCAPAKEHGQGVLY